MHNGPWHVFLHVFISQTQLSAKILVKQTWGNSPNSSMHTQKASNLFQRWKTISFCLSYVFIWIFFQTSNIFLFYAVLWLKSYFRFHSWFHTFRIFQNMITSIQFMSITKMMDIWLIFWIKFHEKFMTKDNSVGYVETTSLPLFHRLCCFRILNWWHITFVDISTNFSGIRKENIMLY